MPRKTKSRKNSAILKLADSLYDSKSIEIAAKEFEDLAEIVIVKKRNHTEVSIASGKIDNVLFEFANYALFLTVQSR